MRAPPPPRRSRSRFVVLCVVRLRQLISGHKLKKRWHLHKLHKFQRHDLVCVSPGSGIRAEDMMNIPSSLRPRNARHRPLLIAAFPKGCSRSPRVRILQRNRLSKLMISKRKYKLKRFDFKNLSNTDDRKNTVTHRCAQTVGSIKKVTAGNADVRVIFHETNVIKCSNIGVGSEGGLHSPELFEFAPNQSIRIRDYPSLRRKSSGMVKVDQAANRFRGSKNSPLLSRRPDSMTSSSDSVPREESPASSGDVQIRPKIIRIIKFADSSVISYSKIVSSSHHEGNCYTLAQSERENRKPESWHPKVSL